MSLDLADFEAQTSNAVKLFWGNRSAAAEAQAALGRVDAGNRGAVTAGKNMDGFFDLMIDIVRRNGLPEADIHLTRKLVTLPGYFRPTKVWDIVVMYQDRLVAVLEMKSQAGPSYGNNFNNRTEEAIGSALDFQTAYRDGAFGDGPKPFLGWLMLVEDEPKSRSPVSVVETHFPVFEPFRDASYLQRYDLLCQRLMSEALYARASLIAAPRTSRLSGEYESLSDSASIRAFISGLAGHVAAVAASL